MKTRVLFVTRSLQTAPGGMQTATRLLLDALRARTDIELSVVGWGGPKWGLPIFFVQALLRSTFFSGACVHFGDAVFAPVIRCLKCVRPGLRVTCTAHGLDVVYPHPLHQLLLKGLHSCDAVAAVSSASKDAVAERGVPTERVVVIGWGTVQEHLAARVPGPPTLLSVGRLIPRKGTAWFIAEVLPALLETSPDLRYIVVGDGPQREHIRSMVSALHLERSVRLLGAITDSDKEKLYAQTDILLMPNVPVAGDMEGFGMACIEAAARGLPTVAARLEGITDAVIQDETGAFFAPSDSRHAAETVRLALARPWDRASVQRSCRARYDIATVASRYANELFAPADDRGAHG
ncbi:MAG TPA: glycosyltransferase family 4 protein [Candidatus Peribacteria bacterium]|nr:glycosyltransferase family 4 protein [Candidatus Peribacteria bacterium]